MSSLSDLLEPVHSYLRQQGFGLVAERQEGDYFVVTIKLDSNQLRHLSVHKKMLVFPNLLPDYLRENGQGLVGQLKNGNVELMHPISP